ncbi:hypothetical protein [Hyalangium sp.]|nr:hypothetical protein [Hyalangium sp.]HYI02947.1 hypothetical protein [Hyalangium sp.]
MHALRSRAYKPGAGCFNDRRRSRRRQPEGTVLYAAVSLLYTAHELGS